jgi:hypothetical protein
LKKEVDNWLSLVIPVLPGRIGYSIGATMAEESLPQLIK